MVELRLIAIKKFKCPIRSILKQSIIIFDFAILPIRSFKSIKSNSNQTFIFSFNSQFPSVFMTNDEWVLTEWPFISEHNRIEIGFNKGIYCGWTWSLAKWRKRMNWYENWIDWWFEEQTSDFDGQKLNKK